MVDRWKLFIGGGLVGVGFSLILHALFGNPTPIQCEVKGGTHTVTDAEVVALYADGYARGVVVGALGESNVDPKTITERQTKYLDCIYNEYKSGIMGLHEESQLLLTGDEGVMIYQQILKTCMKKVKA